MGNVGSAQRASVAPAAVADDEHPQPEQHQHSPSAEQMSGTLQTHGDLGQQRITVDIRGADLDDGETYQVFVHKHGLPKKSSASRHVSAGYGLLQALLGLAISGLTAVKLFEDIKLARVLRRQMSSLGSMLNSMPDDIAGGFAPVTESLPGPSSNPEQKQQQPVSLTTALDEALEPKDDAKLKSPRWDTISGLDDVKQILQEVTVLPSIRPELFKGIRQPPRGILLFGPPGAGKTLLARAVANESGATFFAITGSSILSMWYGASEGNVRALFEKAREHQPAVIFIDEVDSLLGRRSGQGMPSGGGGGEADRRVTDEFLSWMDGIRSDSSQDARVVVMAATNHPWDLDEAALSRFARRIYVPLPERSARAHLLAECLRDVEVNISPAEYLQLADKCAKYSGRDLVMLCREASMRPLRELWGGKLLSCNAHKPKTADSKASESMGDDEKRSRVVSMLVKHMEAGRSARRVRKMRQELESWRKAQGNPGWCDVDAILVEAAEKARASSKSKKGESATQETKDVTSIQPVGGSTACMQSDQQNFKQLNSSSIKQQTTADASHLQQPNTANEDTAQTTLGHDNSSHTNTSHQNLTSDDNRSLDSPACSDTQTVNHSSNGSISSPQLVKFTLQPTSTPSSPVKASISTVQADNGLRPDYDAVQGNHIGDSNNASSCQSHQLTNLESTAESVPSQHSLPTVSSPDHTTAGKLLTREEPQACHVSTSVSDKQPSRPAKEAAAGKQSVAETLEQVADLPLDRVRPVTVKDFDAALKQIMPSQEDMTQQYEEFNAKYGSGADVKSTSKASYLHIYT